MLGIFCGGIIATNLLANPQPIQINAALAKELAGYGITYYNGLVPQQLFNWHTLLSLKGFLIQF